MPASPASTWRSGFFSGRSSGRGSPSANRPQAGDKSVSYEAIASPKGSSRPAGLRRQLTFADTSELQAAGFSEAQARGIMLARGMQADALTEAETASHDPSLETAAYKPNDLRDAGFTPAELHKAGFSAAVLMEAGFSPRELKDSSAAGDDATAVASLKQVRHSAAEMMRVHACTRA